MIARCPDCDVPTTEKVRRAAWVTSRVYVCPMCGSEWPPGPILGIRWPEDATIRSDWLPKEAWKSQAEGEIIIVKFVTHYTVLVLP